MPAVRAGEPEISAWNPRSRLYREHAIFAHVSQCACVRPAELHPKGRSMQKLRPISTSVPRHGGLAQPKTALATWPDIEWALAFVT